MKRVSKSNFTYRGYEVIYSRPNQAFFVMWQDTVLRILPDHETVKNVIDGWFFNQGK